MDKIKIFKGVYTSVEVDLSNFNFNNVKEVILSVKNHLFSQSPVIIERKYTEPRVYHEVITPEESLLLEDRAYFDFDKITIDDKRFKTSTQGEVIVQRGCGQCQITE